MSPLTSVSASRIEQLPGQIRKLVDVRNGQKHATERKFFPAYVLAKMELTAYHLSGGDFSLSQECIMKIRWALFSAAILGRAPKG